MRFVVPEGADLVADLATGTLFQVALVRERGPGADSVLSVCKRLLPRVRDEPAGRAAIVREASLLSRVHHRALPELRRVGLDAHGPFLIEAWVEGVSVRGLVDGWRARGSVVPPRIVAHLAAAAAEALAELHELTYAGEPLLPSHGDVGPDHVLLSPIGEARFVDLGAARFAGMDASLETGDRGTLPFVAPEVARGEEAPSPAADVYALAATVLFLATGEPLTRAQGEAALLLEIGERGLSTSQLTDAAGLSDAAKAAIRDALVLEPRSRLCRARDLAAALSR